MRSRSAADVAADVAQSFVHRARAVSVVVDGAVDDVVAVVVVAADGTFAEEQSAALSSLLVMLRAASTFRPQRPRRRTVRECCRSVVNNAGANHWRAKRLPPQRTRLLRDLPQHRRHHADGNCDDDANGHSTAVSLRRSVRSVTVNSEL